MSEELDEQQQHYEEPEIRGCPKCGSNDIRRSKDVGLWAAIQRTFGRWPFRCRSCRTRFYRPTEPPPELD